uniref:SUEL-type lectin domain-containing protein n=1 Tax=Neogobius melanostomus TaxID=47308 RepID=A0A8C6SGS2_9GOBI
MNYYCYYLRTRLTHLKGFLQQSLTLNVSPADANHVIRIHEVDYGRQDYSTCAVGHSQCQVQNVFCSTPGATYRVAEACNGRQTCIVRASSSVFGEPCAGTAKYMQVSYFCERKSVARILCLSAPGKVIRVHAADYGRRNSQTCAAGRPASQLQNVHCLSSTPTYEVARTCNGRNICSISSSNPVYGDPCPGTDKYLHLSFYSVSVEFWLMSLRNKFSNSLLSFRNIDGCF